jgi:hypothetical protein
MDNQLTDKQLLQRYLALKLLRENIHYSEPNKYNALDFMDDFPGNLRTSVGLFNDVPPSLAIISRDAEKRKEQIRSAIIKIKNAKESKSELGRQMLDNSLKMGLGSAPISFLLSSAIQLMGFRGVRTAGGKLRLPFAPLRATKNILRNPIARKDFLRSATNDAAIGALLGVGSGAAVPLLSRKSELSEEALNDAAKVMQERPYISSFPVADVLSVMKRDEFADKHPALDKAKNIALGGGIGGALGAAAGATAPWLQTPGILWSAIRNSGLTRGAAGTIKSEIGNIAKHQMPLNAKKTAVPMALAGAALGALTKSLKNNETKSTESNLA